MAEEKQAAEGGEASEAKGGSKVMLFAIIGAVVVLLGGGGAFFVMSKSEPPAEEDAEEHVAAEPPKKEESHSGSTSPGAGIATPGKGGEYFPLEAIVVNISDRDRDRFLKLKAELELSNLTVADELRIGMPQIKDVIITLLSAQSLDDIKCIEGKDLLKEEILTRLNAMVKTGKVRRVFFTEFVVQ